MKFIILKHDPYFKEEKPHFFKEKDEEHQEDDKTIQDGKPNLRSKVKGTKEDLTPDQRIDLAFSQEKKKK